MRNEKEIKETEIPDMTVDEVLNAGTDTLTQLQFAVLAKAATDVAVSTAGNAAIKHGAFITELVRLCQLFGDPLDKLYVFVIARDIEFVTSYYYDWRGERLFYYQLGSDNYRYIAQIF